jgi:Cu(I)/Ag(I) efflux system periplasmic protein CusF
MKHLVAVAAVAALFFAAAPTVTAQMKAMDMKGMKAEKKTGGQVHKGTGIVTNVDRAGGKVTVKHDPIKSLNWPTMTMAFSVKDKAMLDKVAKDKKVQFEFVQQGEQFVITSIK